MSLLSWLVADSLTGKLVGRFVPDQWSYEDPLTGSSKGSVTVPIPEDADPVVEAERIAQLRDWLTPHRRQIVVRDEQGRWWWGGPIVTKPRRNPDGTVTVAFGDWRTWFYSAPIRPNTNGTRRDYIRVAGGAGQVEQCAAIAALATLGLDTVGAPRLVVDGYTDSGILRDVTHRMFKMTGEAMDNVARRERGPDWHTYMTDDPVDRQAVVAHLLVSYPERRQTVNALRLFQRFFHKQDVGSNILTYELPNPVVPPARVYGVGPTPPPAEEWATATNPDLDEGLRLAWDEIWRLPEGVTTGPSAFEHTLARLNAHSSTEGIAKLTIDPALTDLLTWGPGDRTRINIDNGWDQVDKPSARILSRTLTGRAEHVLTCTIDVNLGIDDDTELDEPTEEVAEA